MAESTIAENVVTHTPGPWTLHASAHQQEFAFWIDTTSPRVMERQRGIAAVLNAGSDESAANALLIAAAPDLLAALKGLIDPAFGVYATTRLIQAAIAAIAKAEGR